MYHKFNFINILFLLKSNCMISNESGLVKKNEFQIRQLNKLFIYTTIVIFLSVLFHFTWSLSKR